MGLSITFDDYTFQSGHWHSREATRLQERGRTGASWGSHFEARGCYLVTMIMQVVAIPLAAINALGCTLYSLVTWQWKTLDKAAHQLLEKVNRFFSGFVGAIINPQISYHARDTYTPAYVGFGIIGAAVVIPIAVYALLKVKVNFWAVDNRGNFTFGYVGR